MRASCGDPCDCGVLMALCMALAPLAMCAKPGDVICWSVACGCGEEVICWLRPDDVRDGIWRTARFRGDCSIDGEGSAGGACGVGVPAGDSLGESSELMSMVRRRARIPALGGGDGCATRFYHDWELIRACKAVSAAGPVQSQASSVG
jgi:hypothetical protein